jgi:ribose transport system ATP-binding protein
MKAPVDQNSPLLAMRSIARRFGTTLALDGVSLELQRGEVHALVGENGAGKSTLIKILAGAEHADAGTIHIDGQPFTTRTPADALRCGIAVVYQEFNLAPHLSIAANLLLGRERTTPPGVLACDLSRSPQRRLCRATLDRLGLSVHLDTKVSRLGVADQQLVEIARALLGGARIVVMDEPTSALAAHEIDRLFAIIHQLRADGIAIIYISHFLEELPRIADRITILRDGQAVGSGALSDWPRDRIIRAMVGRDVADMYPRVPHTLGQPLLDVRNLSGTRRPRDASFTLHRGEILGIAGLIGAGRTETLRTLFGLDPVRGGAVTLGGLRILHLSPSDLTGRGVALLSEDRKAEGLAQNLSAADNVTLPALKRTSRFGFLRPASTTRQVVPLANQLRIKWSNPNQKTSSLSGGNQQKLALARLLYLDADILLLDEPTRGIDVAAKVDIYHAIGRLAAAGKAVVMVSSYLPELLGICDRIAVMSRGVLSEAYDAKELTADRVMHLAIGEVPIVPSPGTPGEGLRNSREPPR